MVDKSESGEKNQIGVALLVVELLTSGIVTQRVSKNQIGVAFLLVEWFTSQKEAKKSRKAKV